MILVHSKGSADPNGTQETVMRLLAGAPYPTPQAVIESHVLQTCGTHAMQALEYLGNSGAVEKPDGSTHVFRLSAAGREWCRERGLRVRSLSDPDEVETPTTKENTDAPKTPRKRGRRPASNAGPVE